jgi:putative transposase
LYARRNLEEAQHDLAAWLNRWQKKYPKLTNWVDEVAPISPDTW